LQEHNIVTITSICCIPLFKVIARLNAKMFIIIYKCMFMYSSVVSKDTIYKTGCSYWTSLITNKITKVKVRLTARLSQNAYIYKIMLSVKVAVLY
jgi:hypothetical protein